jgi:TonB family protein
LLTRVEPDLPQETIDARLNSAEVTVSFTVNADGSVVNAAVTASTDRRLNRSILRAVGEWRYAPLPAPLTHSVKFSFATR